MAQKKLHKLKRHISAALKCEWINARFLAKIAGECIAMMRAIVPAKLLLRNIYRTLETKSSPVFIDEHCRNDLNWWFSSLKNWNGASLVNHNPEIQIEMDASGSGWGGTIRTLEKEASGMWQKSVSLQPSNFRELFVILKCIQLFQNNLKGVRSVQILCDNVTSVAYVNKLEDEYCVISTISSQKNQHLG